MAITPTYSWPLPDDDNLVKDGAEAIRDLGNAIDTTVSGLGSGLVHIVSATKTDTFSTTSQTYTDVTGLSVTITPQSASNKILILASVNCGFSSTSEDNVACRITGGNATTYVGATAGSRTSAAAHMRRSSGGLEGGIFCFSLNYLDSPATTSATTYKIQILTSIATGTAFVNRSGADTDRSDFGRTASTITVLEVSV